MNKQKYQSISLSSLLYRHTNLGSPNSTVEDSSSESEGDHARPSRRSTRGRHRRRKETTKDLSDTLLKLMKDLSERWERLVERVVVGSRASSEVATSSIVILERETIPKFRCLKEGDIITYLINFEDYYDTGKLQR